MSAATEKFPFHVFLFIPSSDLLNARSRPPRPWIPMPYVQQIVSLSPPSFSAWDMSTIARHLPPRQNHALRRLQHSTYIPSLCSLRLQYGTLVPVFASHRLLHPRYPFHGSYLSHGTFLLVFWTYLTSAKEIRQFLFHSPLTYRSCYTLN